MPEWSEARVKSFIVSLIRSGSRRWPPRYETLNEAKTEKKINKKTGRLAQHYRCAECKQEFTSKDIQIDHILPVVDPAVGFVDWNTFIERMFCPKENMQCLCTTCHTKKSNLEKHAAKEARKK